MTAISWMPPSSNIVQASSQVAGDIDIWLSSFYTKMNELDLTQTADTGQYVIGATNTYSNIPNGGGSFAYRMYRLDDVLSSTTPLYIKLEFSAELGTKTNGFSVAGVVTVGTATNGYGGFVGKILTQKVYAGWDTTIVPHVASYQSYATTNANYGCMALIFNPGINANNGSQAVYAPFAFIIERVPNADGTPSDLGVSLFTSSVAFNTTGYPYNAGGLWGSVSVFAAKTLMFEANTIYEHTAGVPYFPQTTMLVEDVLINHAYHSTPRPIRSGCFGSVLRTKVNAGTQFGFTPYGNVERNVLAVSSYSAFRPSNVGDLIPIILFE